MVKKVDGASAATVPKADLLLLQSRMKQDPGGYEAELELQLCHFRACLNVLALQGPVAAEAASDTGTAVASTPASAGHDHVAAKELGDMAMFLAHVTPSYPQHLADFPKELLNLLGKLGAVLPAALRRHIAQALILLRNREKIDLVDVLPVMMELQCFGDKALKKLVFSHLMHNICQMNRKHRNEVKNRALQNLIFPLLQEDDEVRAKNALVLLCELHRRKIWTDERTSNAICNACFHKSSRIMIASLKFLHGYDNNYDDESDDSDNDEDGPDGKSPGGAVAVNREAMYKAYHKGTVSSRKRKQAKLERAVRSMKKQQRIQAQGDARGSFAPLQQLHDAQSFAEKLFTRLKNCNEKFQVKLMMIIVISRCVGMHQLVLMNLYPYLQRYVSPHQQDETQLLAAVVQASHEKVPADVVEPLLKQLVNSFIHDRSRPEVIAVGLNVVREMCTRMPLIMTRELLEDLSLYKKSREKAVSSASNSIIALYRQINPSLLKKKDRGRGADLSVQPRAFGEAIVHTDVPGVELLAAQYEDTDEDKDSEDNSEGHEASSSNEDDEDEGLEDLQDVCIKYSEDDGDDQDENSESGSDSDELEDDETSDQEAYSDDEEHNEEDAETEHTRHKRRKIEGNELDPRGVGLEDMSLNQLKKLASPNVQIGSIDIEDGILSNENFERIRKLQAKEVAKAALGNQGIGKNKKVQLKLPSSDSLSERPFNPSKLEANIRKKQNKEERIATSKAGREDRAPYGARTAIKQQKTGGLSNRQKEKMKSLPVAARRAKAARSREHRKSTKRRSTKQFRGKKAWK